MNFDDQRQFDAIVDRQREARALLEDVDRRITQLQVRLESATAQALKPAAPTKEWRTVPIEPPPLPTSAVHVPENAIILSHLSVPELPPQETPLTERQAAPLAPAAELCQEAQEPIELRLGSYWLVRVGIAIFLTGLVFLGNFAYHRFVAPLGAPGKLIMLYAIGGALAAVGARLDRARPAMRNYGKVLLAGGCAAIYYTTFAAHYVATLRVIESPLIAGTLLLAMAGGIVWVAERKHSETLALLAVVLGFYTSCINAIGEFTLFSTFLLAAAALVFQWRHCWSRLMWAGLVGTYGSYAFWRFHHLITNGMPASSTFASGCLVAYWVVFAAALFGPRSARFAHARPTIFFTINNAAFFLLAGFNVATTRPDAYWLFVTLFGIALLLLALGIPERWCAAASLRTAALAQALALTTLGLATKLAGPQLALVFAAESAVLLVCAQWRHRLLLQTAAGLLGAAASVITVRQLESHPHLVLPLGLTVSAFLLFDASWIKRVWYPDQKIRSFGAAFFALLGLAVIWAVVWDAATPAFRPVWFGVTALAITLLHRPLRLPEIVLPAQACVLAGASLLINHRISAPLPPALFLVTALLLEQWWQRSPPRGEARAWQFLPAGCAMFVALHWVFELPQADHQMVILSAAALATFVYGLAVPAWGTLLVGQIFTVAAGATYGYACITGHPDPFASLAPIAATVLIGWLLQRFAGRIAHGLFPPDRLRSIGRGYGVAAGSLVVAWVFEFVPAAWQSPFFALLGMIALGIARIRPGGMARILGVISGAVACLLIWARFEHPVTILQLAGVIGVASAAQILASSFAGASDETARHDMTGLLISAIATIWWWVTRWTLLEFGAKHLTVSWSLLALAVFLIGFVAHARVYRLAGMTFVTVAIGRLFLVDVWQFDTLLRIVSFLVLGAVLLVLGFFYNRFAEQVRRWW